jgi:hypothetical protein
MIDLKQNREEILTIQFCCHYFSSTWDILPKDTSTNGIGFLLRSYQMVVWYGVLLGIEVLMMEYATGILCVVTNIGSLQVIEG